MEVFFSRHKFYGDSSYLEVVKIRPSTIQQQYNGKKMFILVTFRNKMHICSLAASLAKIKKYYMHMYKMSRHMELFLLTWQTSILR
jgi:hypothetical protein